MRCQSFPAVSAKDLFRSIVCHLGVGHGDLALESGLVSFAQRLVDRSIYPANKERRHRRDLAHLASRIGELFQSGDIGFGQGFVLGQGKDQCDVDVDACGDEAFYGGNTLWSGWHFDHDVGPVQRSEKAFDLGYCIGCVVGKLRVYFEADISVKALRLVIDRPKQVRGARDVFQYQCFVYLLH